MKRWLSLLLFCSLAWAQGYVVQPGDTLERIARLFQVSVSDIMLLNGLMEDPLPAGLQIAIPPSDWDPMNLEVLPLAESAEEPPGWVFIRPPLAPPEPQKPPVQVYQQGLASWYGARFHGRRTANGERFNKHLLTAAIVACPLTPGCG